MGRAAVEKPGNRVRQQCAARHRPDHDLGGLDNRWREHVEQVLGETPDRRGIPKELMRIQIDRTVESVPEIEVPIEHQHFVLLQVLQRLLAYLVSSVHNESRSRSNSSTRSMHTQLRIRVDEYRAAADDRRRHPSTQLPPVERRVLRLRSQRACSDSSRAGQVRSP